MVKNKSKISIVGAGPGDVELLTIKAFKAIQKADVILYDALINKEMLGFAKTGCQKIYVGKRAREHSHPQEEINFMMVQFAYTHGHVVRLKGGDPFVFGRGHEEITYADSFDIETEIIPGISSSIAVPELQKVPLTRRGVNESFWVMTACTRDGNLSNDVRIAAQSTATAVILMGLKKLPLIVKEFVKNGKASTSVMVIQNGSLPNEKFVLGCVENIVERVKEEQIGTPAIIVIGEVVSLHPELNLAIKKVNHKE